MAAPHPLTHLRVADDPSRNQSRDLHHRDAAAVGQLELHGAANVLPLGTAVEGREVSLTPTEWRFLSYLARNEGHVMSHAALAEKVWGTEFLQGSAIKMCVRRLRQKLGDHSSPAGVIRTPRGIGYSFARPS